MTEPAHELKFAFSDFLTLLKKHKKIVYIWMAVGAITCALFAVTRPVNYIVKATFRDKGKTHVGFSNSLSDLIFNPGASPDSEAASTMKSQLLLAKTIKDLNLQGSISKVEKSHPDIVNAKENLLSEYAHWSEKKTPILPEIESPLKLSAIHYPGETPEVFLIRFDSREQFTVADRNNNLLGEGSIGSPFGSTQVSFTITSDESFNPSEEALYAVVVQPMSEMAAILGNQLQIDPDKEDKTLLKLQFRHRNRKLASAFLNRLMENYQAFLEGQHELTSDTQLHYLKRRQIEVGNDLQKLMENHVQKVSEDMAQSGFTSLQKEMEFLGAKLSANQDKIQEIDLETKRLTCIDPEECVHYDSYTSRGDPQIINHLLAELRNLKQESDSLEIALQMTPEGSDRAKSILSAHFATLQETEKCAREVKELEEFLVRNEKGSFPLNTLKSKQFPVASWLETLKEKERAVNFAHASQKEEKQEEYAQFKDHLLAYLENFRHLLKIKEASFSQRMRTLQSPNAEMEGTNLATCKELYLNFTRELNDISAQAKQHLFVVEQLKNHDFEVCSLTALLRDPISQERIAKASQLMIQLKDENNHTQKELERLKIELDLQKQFLSSHILQIAELLALKETLLKEKVLEIQAITLEQIQQKSALLKKNLSDYIAGRIQNLQQEKAILSEHQSELHSRMREIPEKWASEQLLNQNLAMQQRFLENLAGMVETKNITKNLEMIQSAALDQAVPTVNPKPPRLVFYTLLGSLLGFMGSSCFLFTRTMIRGVPASKENLLLSGFHVSGTISPFQGDETAATPPLLDGDLDSLRRLVAHFESTCKESLGAKKILAILGNGPDFTNTLAMLLAKKGQRILKLSLSLNGRDEAPGLLQYLEGSSPQPQIQHLDDFDWIPSGGSSRYSEELLLSKRFKQLLQQLNSQYDWVLAECSSEPSSAEAENLARLFDGTAVLVTDQSLPALIHFSECLNEEKQQALTFLLAR